MLRNVQGQTHCKLFLATVLIIIVSANLPYHATPNPRLFTIKYKKIDRLVKSFDENILDH